MLWASASPSLGSMYHARIYNGNCHCNPVIRAPWVEEVPLLASEVLYKVSTDYRSNGLSPTTFTATWTSAGNSVRPLSTRFRLLTA